MIKLVAYKRIDVTKLITKHIALEDVVAEGFECLARNKEKKEMKIQVICNED